MNNKFEMNDRNRKTNNRIRKRDRSYLTSQSFMDEKHLKNWQKKNNSKKGGKSRHIN